MRIALVSWLGAVLLSSGLAGGALADDGATIRGRVSVDAPGLTLARIGPVVAYLEPVGGHPAPPAVAPATVAQLNARFEPSFLVVTRGQTVQMPNQDAIYHNVFSFSRPNDFDLGLYPAGDSRSVVFEHAGVVRAYCSIHESMNATIFVAPGPHHALVRTDGRFEMHGVPPGRYTLSTWCERLPATAMEVVVEGDADLEVEIQLLSLPR